MARTPSVTRRASLTLAGAGALTALAGCAPSAPSASPSPTRTGYRGLPITGAAEPGDAPVPTRDPAGRVVALPSGTHPWGVAVAPELRTVYTAARRQDRLVAVDLSTLTATPRAVPGSARMIDRDGPGGSLLLPAENRNTLFRLALPSLEVLEAVPTGKQPHQAVQVGGTAFVTEEYGHAVRVVRDGRGVRGLDQPVQPGGITAVPGRVAAVDVATNHLFVWDTQSLQLLAVLPAGAGPSHVVPSGGTRVAVCDVRGRGVLTYELGGKPAPLGRADVPGRAFWICADMATGTIYTALANTNLVAKLRTASDGSPELVATAPTVRQPISMDLDPEAGMLYVAGYAESQLQLLPLDAFSA